MVWSRKRRFLESPPLDPDSPETTIVAAGTRLEGELVVAGDASVAGRVDGRLEVRGRLLLAQGGEVHGELHARDAKVEGTVEGPIRVDDRLEVGATANITGDLSAARIAVAEGAVVRGALNSEEPARHFTEQRTRG